MSYLSVYKMYEVLNGYAVVDSDSSTPNTPIYFVPYAKESQAIASEIYLLMVSEGGDDIRLKKFEKYKYKPSKHGRNI